MLGKLINPIWWVTYFFTGPTFRWWLACEIFSLAAFPTCFIILRPLKDKGYGFAKVFGIFFITFLNWYLCTILSFSFLSVAISLLFVVALGGYCLKRQRERIIGFFRNRWKLILVYELIFLFAFLFFVNVRSYRPEAMFNPSESGAEKMLNCAYLHALLRTSHFPPGDTWFWGDYAVKEEPTGKDGETREKLIEAADAPEGAAIKTFHINYYYFGHLMWATVARFSFNEARYAFNLGLASIFALSFLAAFSLGVNLTRRYRWGVLAAFMIVLFGNFDALQQMMERMGQWLARKGPDQTAWELLMDNKDVVFYSVDFWRTSRIIEYTVTEFPYFSAILGDLHPHHSSLPLVLLVIGTGMSLVMSVSRSDGSLKTFFRRYGHVFLFLALVIGGTFVTNTWDAIVMGFFGAVLMSYIHLRHHGNSWRGWGYTIVTTDVLGILSVFLFLLFKLFFQSPIQNEIRLASLFPLKFEKFKLMVAPVSHKLRTELTDYFVLFGLFLFPVIVYFATLVISYLKKRDKAIRWTWFFAALFFLIFSRNAWRFWLPGMAIVTLALTVSFLIDGKKGRRTNFFLLLFLVAAFFTLFVETLYFDDRMVGENERYNTLFKIYYPLWSILGVCAAFSFAKMFRKVIIRKRWGILAWLSLFLLFIVFSGMLYPVQSTAMRTDFFQTTEKYETGRKERHRTLDATEYISRDMSVRVDIGGNQKRSVNLKNDAAVISWIRENVKGQPVILEAIGGCYVPFSRMASMTGLPTLVGWSHHVAQHRGGSIYDLLGPREQDVKEIYTSEDVKKTRRLLKKYKIEYVMFGSLERAKYSPRAEEKFSQMLKEVFRNGDSLLYKVPWEVP